jgi:hypothetical protein
MHYVTILKILLDKLLTLHFLSLLMKFFCYFRCTVLYTSILFRTEICAVLGFKRIQESYYGCFRWWLSYKTVSWHNRRKYFQNYINSILSILSDIICNFPSNQNFFKYCSTKFCHTNAVYFFCVMIMEIKQNISVNHSFASPSTMEKRYQGKLTPPPPHVVWLLLDTVRDVQRWNASVIHEYLHFRLRPICILYFAIVNTSLN